VNNKRKHSPQWNCSISVHIYRPKKQINIKVKMYAKYQSLHLRRLSTLNRCSFKCSRNHFISHKCKTVLSFKLHFLPNSHLVQIFTFSNDCKSVRNITGSHFVKSFQLFRRIFNDVSSITKAPPCNADFSR
jgi:hypothetical protein